MAGLEIGEESEFSFLKERSGMWSFSTAPINEFRQVYLITSSILMLRYIVNMYKNGKFLKFLSELDHFTHFKKGWEITYIFQLQLLTALPFETYNE